MPIAKPSLLSRTGRRRVGLAWRTLLGSGSGGFFLPYRHAAAIRPTGYQALDPLFAACGPSFLALLDRIEELERPLRAIAGPPPQPRWDQDWFPRLDAAALYAMVATSRPRRILEIGSGHSTRFAVRALADQGLADGTRVICIDPAPRADLAGLEVQLERRTLSPADAEMARGLAAGDILFVDSSHLLMPGTDVDILVNGFLPRLAAGVLVHFHDIFLPDPYPAAWQWRGYNEQQAVATLLHGGGYALRFASHYVALRHPGRLDQGVLGSLPLLPGAIEGSLWLEKLPSAYAAPVAGS